MQKSIYAEWASSLSKLPQVKRFSTSSTRLTAQLAKFLATAVGHRYPPPGRFRCLSHPSNLPSHFKAWRYQRFWAGYRLQLGGLPLLTVGNLSNSPELEFLNKMPNPGILESRDLSWGDIYRFHVQCLKIVLNVSWDIFCNGINSLISNTASCFEFWIGLESYEYFIKINPTSYVCWKSPCEFHLQREVT